MIAQMDTTKTPAVHPLTEKTLNDAPLGYNSAEAGAWANGYNSAIEDRTTLAAENQRMRDALERLHDTALDARALLANQPAPIDRMALVSLLTDRLAEAREVLASLTT